MPRKLLPPTPPLLLPGTDKRALRLPDLRGLVVPRLSGTPLTEDEIDYDDLIIHRSYRSYDPSRPAEVRYMMYELSQKDPQSDTYHYFWKAIRMARVTRVPRYLRRSTSSGPNMVFEQQRDILSALRESQVLFINLIAKSATLPMIFAYGAQGVGDTPESAMAMADEGWAVLSFQLDGVFQQLKYQQLTMEEAESLVRYQSEWRHIAMSRGRPVPAGGNFGSANLFDGNRTEVESTLNQLESFLRGMNDKEFMLSLVTVPVSPDEMTLAWRNITSKLSTVRSEQQGMRAVTAGVALPLSMGQSLANSSGTGHSIGVTSGTGQTQGTSQTLTDAVSHTQTLGTSHTLTDGTSQTTTAGASHTQTLGTSHTLTAGTSKSVTDGTSHTLTSGTSKSLTDGTSQTQTQGASQTTTDGTSQGTSAGTSQGTTVGQSTGLAASTTQTQGASGGTSTSATGGTSVGTSTAKSLTDTASLGQSTSTSLAAGASTGASHSTTVGQSATASQGSSQGINHGASSSTGQTLSATGGTGTSFANSTGNSSSSSVNGGIPGVLGGGTGSGANAGQSAGTNSSNSTSDALSGTAGTSVGTNAGVNSSLSQGLSSGVTGGTNTGQSLTDTHGLGTNTGQSLASGLTAGSNSSLSLSNTAGTNTGFSNSLAQGSTLSQGVSTASTDMSTVGTSQGTSQSNAIGASSSVAGSTSLAAGVGSSQSTAGGTSLSAGVGSSQSLAGGTSASAAAGSTLSSAAGTSQSVAVGSSASVADGTSVSNAAGTSNSTSTQSALADTSNTTFGQSIGSTAAVGVVPSVGFTVSRNVFDESKRILGDVLEAQTNRYLEGVEGGAFFYQMFLVTPTRELLVGAAGLLKSSFWGLGNADQRLPQPFHTITDFADPDEPARLLLHARAFTQYRRRERDVSLIEPYMYSSYVTMMEAAAFCHPPTSESPGIMGMVDSMPVLAMPMNRQHRDIHLGRIVDGERDRVSSISYGIDTDELTHTLLAGVTGTGKTTTLMTMLSEISRVQRTVVDRATPTNPLPTSRDVRAGILGLDWMSNLRDLASVVEPDRFRFFSIAKPDLGEFRWNPLALPDDMMDPVEWAGDTADNMTISFGLGEFGRSIIAELLSDLYSANRLEPFSLRSEVRDPNTNVVLRPGVYLPAVDRDMLPAGAIQIDIDGTEYANVLTCPALSRLISMADLATLVLNKVEEAATVEGARLHGPAFRDRIQSLWRRVSYFAPGSMYEGVFKSDDRLDERTTLNVSDLVDPEKGLVTIIETDGLDLVNRRFVLGSVLLAVWRYGQFKGAGCFDQNGRGPGTFVCMEEAHELFGEQNSGEDAFSASTRTALYESMFRRSRALGMKLIAVVQNCSSIPTAVTSNTTTVIIHRQQDDHDKSRAFSLLNWDKNIGAQQREWRYLGEMAMGFMIIRLDAKKSYLESAPIQLLVEPAALSKVTDGDLAALISQRVHGA